MSDEPAVFHFENDTLAEFHFTLGKDRKPHVLVEAEAETVFKYRNEVARVATLEDGKLSKVGNVADADGYLLSMCLYAVNADGSRKQVPITTLRKWPNKLVKQLLERLEEMSDLGGSKTIVQVEKEIAKLTKKLARLKSDEEGTTGPKDGPTDAGSSSPSPTPRE
jgi:hypothetical protein